MIKFVRLCLDRFFFSRSCCCRCRCCCCFFFILLSGVNCPIFLEKLYTPIVLSSSSDSAPVLFLALYLCKKLSGKADNKRANTHTHTTQKTSLLGKKNETQPKSEQRKNDGCKNEIYFVCCEHFGFFGCT